VVEVTQARQAKAQAATAAESESTPKVAARKKVKAKKSSPSAKAPSKPPAPSAPIKPGKAGVVKGRLKSGQSLFAALTQHNLQAAQIQPAINSLSAIFDFRKSRPKDRYEVRYDPDGRVMELRYQRNLEMAYVAKRGASDEFSSSKVKAPLKTKIAALGGTVRSSLSRAILDAGEGQQLVSKFVDVFAYDIDFGSDTKPGDTFRLVYEKIYIDGELIRYGRVLAAEYKGAHVEMRAYVSAEKGGTAHYNNEGHALRRMFLRNPVKGARLTSKFGKRFHPVLKKWKNHNGVDYAAPSGTPINPIANGTVLFASEKGANGNLIVVEHAGGWVSYYAHLLRFGRGIKKGSKVRQSTVIGYVGSTGRSTGPHLHLGVKQNGQFKDPLKIQSTRSIALEGAELKKHKRWVRELDRKLNACTVQPPSDGPSEPEPMGGDDMDSYEDNASNSGGSTEE
ncbi:MAG: M23 family metallopeptidase, partial [Myxococcota bacterium]